MKIILFFILFIPLIPSTSFPQLPNQNMYLVKNLNTRPQGGSYSAIWGYLAPNGREYAILGCYGGTQFVDVTDSANVVEVGWLPSTNPSSGNNTWREMKVYSHYAYIVSEVANSGIQIVDLQYLPDSIRYVGQYMMPGHSSTHSISQEGHYLYLNGANAGFGSGTVIVDISNPEMPVKRGGWNGLYVHDSRILNDTIWAANINSSRVSVIDAVNKDAPQLVTQWVNLPNSGPHNCAITQDRTHILVTDEIGATPRLMKIWNIEDLSNITYVTNWQPTGITTSVVHNVEIYGNYALVAHYTAGVRLVDISNPAQPAEVAWYDTYPADNAGSYNGCWGVYMFPSGKIIASDRQTGLYVLKTTVLINPPLNNFSLSTPSQPLTVTTLPGSNQTVNFAWDTSSSGATYKWIFGNPLPERKITLSSSTNSINVNLGILDNLLHMLGVTQGDSIVGQWDVWAFRNNPHDSLKSSNGPRTVTLKRGIPQLSPFSLVSPANNTTIITSVFNNSNVTFNWSKSGQGTSYKWKFGSPSIANVLLDVPTGFDSSFTFVNSGLDVILGGLGLNPGDSMTGQWAVWAYSGTDSLKSTQTYNVTFKRQDKGDILVLYDSTSVTGRASLDTVLISLNALDKTYDLFNRGSQTSSNALTLRGYKTVMLLGSGTSVMNNRLKDSVIAYLNSSGTSPFTKAQLVILSEDIGYQFGRSGSTYQDLNFVNNYLGWSYVADRPASGANQGLIGGAINPGLTDSTNGTWPDVIRKQTVSGAQGQHVLYLFRRHLNNPDSASGVGIQHTNFNVATMCSDARNLLRAWDSPSGSASKRIIEELLWYVSGEIVNTAGNTEELLPGFYELVQNYPNPFNPVTKIKFAIPIQGFVSLKVFDVTGREVATLVNEPKSPGYYSVDFNASMLSSGVYFYRLESSDFIDVKRMILIK